MAINKDTPVYEGMTSGFKINLADGTIHVTPQGIRHISDAGEMSDTGTLIFVDDQTTAYEFSVNLVGLTVYKCLRCGKSVDADDIDSHALIGHLTSKIALTEVPITK